MAEFKTDAAGFSVEDTTKRTKDSEFITFQFLNFVLFATFVVNEIKMIVPGIHTETLKVLKP